jgi:hypothetical protein
MRWVWIFAFALVGCAGIDPGGNPPALLSTNPDLDGGNFLNGWLGKPVGTSPR